MPKRSLTACSRDYAGRSCRRSGDTPPRVNWTSGGAPYGSVVGLTGVIFAGIAALWLVYLVPYFLHHRVPVAEEGADEAVPFIAGAVTVVRAGESLADADEGAAQVSTPLTRRAALRELRLIDDQAAQRRRQVLLFLLVVQSLVAGLAAFGIGAWWGALVPATVIGVFLVVARFGVKKLRADLAVRADRIRNSVEEETVALALTVEDVAQHEHSVELSIPLQGVGSLWEPIPITRPTYVSKPLAPRTVRTIDLAAPVASPSSVPVTADPPTAAPSAESGREVG